jgi:hypothetical protein
MRGWITILACVLIGVAVLGVPADLRADDGAACCSGPVACAGAGVCAVGRVAAVPVRAVGRLAAVPVRGVSAIVAARPIRKVGRAILEARPARRVLWMAAGPIRWLR